MRALPARRTGRALATYQLGILLGRLVLSVEVEAGVHPAERATHAVEAADQWEKLVEWLEALQRRSPAFA